MPDLTLSQAMRKDIPGVRDDECGDWFVYDEQIGAIVAACPLGYVVLNSGITPVLATVKNAVGRYDISTTLDQLFKRYPVLREPPAWKVNEHDIGNVASLWYHIIITFDSKFFTRLDTADWLEEHGL